jgi:hypothetical protein
MTKKTRNNEVLEGGGRPWFMTVIPLRQGTFLYGTKCGIDAHMVHADI